ncbi:hypothetical protein HPB52_017504 [Rhipicephalus sanguineus]|uniref:Uncharacterized protein n=1 Tax=Rhipicephalus sanguineus TaxID=34632 RepID=A0A9D4PCT3_RHISA|nr:hypothetical protein HPB52_017504 [Rhipicephalus sanguineus]
MPWQAEKAKKTKARSASRWIVSVIRVLLFRCSCPTTPILHDKLVVVRGNLCTVPLRVARSQASCRWLLLCTAPAEGFEDKLLSLDCSRTTWRLRPSQPTPTKPVKFAHQARAASLQAAQAQEMRMKHLVTMLPAMTSRLVLSRLKINLIGCTTPTNSPPESVSDSLFIPPLPKNTHPTHNHDRRMARARSLHKRYASSTPVAYVDAAEYSHRPAFAVAVSDNAHKLLCCATFDRRDPARQYDAGCPAHPQDGLRPANLAPFAAVDRELTKRFSDNPFGFACTVCERLWFTCDLRDAPACPMQCLRTMYPATARSVCDRRVVGICRHVDDFLVMCNTNGMHLVHQIKDDVLSCFEELLPGLKFTKSPAVIPYVHGRKHSLKKIANRQGLRTLFSAPNKASTMCRRVSNDKEGEACGKRHRTQYAPCQQAVELSCIA